MSDSRTGVPPSMTNQTSYRERGSKHGLFARLDIAARAKELWADPHNYTYDHIGRLLSNEFSVPLITKGSVAKFYYESGLNRRTSQAIAARRRRAARPKPIKGDDARAKQRARSMRKPKVKAPLRRTADAVKLEAVKRESSALAIGETPSEAFDLATWPHNERAIALAQLRDGLCRWPFELPTGEHVSCGLNTSVLSYCPYHAGMAYRAAPSEERSNTGATRGSTDNQAGDAEQGPGNGEDDMLDPDDDATTVN